MVTMPFNWLVSYQTSIHLKRYQVSTSFMTVHKFYCQKVYNERLSNANTLIGYKMSYYRSMYSIQIYNADINYCLLRAKPLCVTPD